MKDGAHLPCCHKAGGCIVCMLEVLYYSVNYTTVEAHVPLHEFKYALCIWDVGHVLQPCSHFASSVPNSS